jgi:transcriptional regulator with XRE-family HTH domain
MSPRPSPRHSARLLFARTVRRLRVERGWSQEELADRAGLHRTYVGSVERGERNISIDNIEKIANALESAIHDMFSHGGA